ncbi:MAG: sulfatase-like hydrolase/transferase [Verrucomicrobia bacterium]|jgi:arylsulfatase A-like enzyme|nr:sulfatase-like hydrolase/transferase [Verrucomicrobiota bacterium]MBT7068087.1 sulfatase-like hydrolase/transferase [Verrucomicrobiota bacterium]MBT7701804.1 sulfatase-like hydrolase/transferase [Verrucomicrobiota bacterium]
MPSDKQNILLIFTDQNRADMLSCYNPGSICRTPHLDAMVEQSVVFKQAYTVCSVCSPARASLQTGLYPHSHGVETNIYNRGCMIHELPDTDYLLSRRLGQADHSAGYTGKWHLGEGGAPAFEGSGGLRPLYAPQHNAVPTNLGYEGDDFPGHGGGGYKYPQYQAYLKANGLTFDVDGRNTADGGVPGIGEVTSPLESTNEYYLVNRAIDTIDDFRQRDQPFCFQLHFWGPHEPYLAPTEFLDLYRDVEIPPWPNFSDTGETKSSFQERSRHRDKPWSYWENSLRHYYGFMSSIDAQIGRLVAYLKEHDLYDTTTIIFSADHGDSQGCHGGLGDKSYHMYEETMRIPLIIKPARAESSRIDVSEFVNTCDIYASILDLAGLPHEQFQHGRSLMPFVDGQAPDDWPQFLVSEGLSASHSLCSHRMIRQGHWKYVFFAAGTDELYDLKEDPWELTNLIDSPEHKPMLKELQAMLLQWMVESNDLLRIDYARLI